MDKDLRRALHLKMSISHKSTAASLSVEKYSVSVSKCDIYGGYSRSVRTRSSRLDGRKDTKASISGKCKIDRPSITFSCIFQPFLFGESQQMLLIDDISKCPRRTCDSFSLSLPLQAVGPHTSHPPTHTEPRLNDM